MRHSIDNMKPSAGSVAVAVALLYACGYLPTRLYAAPGGGPSLIAHWRLDESSGTMAKDSVGGNDGFVNGSLQWHPYGGRLDGTLEFGGVNEYIHCGDAGVFNLTAGITVSAWVNIGEVRYDWQAIVTKGDSAWRLSTAARERRFHFGVTGGPDYQAVDGNTTVRANEWRHVCGTYDGQYLRLYLDGEPDAAALPYTGGIGVNAFPVQIGANAEQLNRRWKGLIDDVRVYNGALTAAEVRALYREAPLYVDADSPGGNGFTWSSAFKSLQDALVVANWGCRIHVASGLYRPDDGGGWSRGDRIATFLLKSGVRVRGGYAGYGQPNPSARDVVLFETVLSGDLSGNDTVPADPCEMFMDTLRSENSRHVVCAVMIADAVLDGFTVTAGHADGSDGAFPRVNNGAGLFCRDSRLTVSNCTFRHN
ncbi:MAG TPA: LamG domain-containing protein, partial [Phycisphaerales bacterium]|nr:LamG domain-containing protein [Phycisphaerales bacterium]